MLNLKTPKGTVDQPPANSILFEKIISKTKEIFQIYGAVPLDTPTFELRDILMNKYGDDSKLVYDLKETGGEICALRYDLTVPFARFMGMNKMKRIKRYQIGKVYRRDQPSVAKGRMREFVQADFDIAGEGIETLSDVEVLSCMCRLLKEYNIGDFIIKFSDRRLLTSILGVCGVEESLYGTICSTIDKIDKLSRDQICNEFIEKGLKNEQITKIFEYIELSGKEEILNILENDKVVNVSGCKNVIDNLRTIFRLSKTLGIYDKLKFTLSLARGLEYYTGIIIEAESTNKNIGSIAGGGRYNKLISSLIDSKNEVPCVGFSIGLTRIFNIMSDKATRESYTSVFVTSSNGLFLEERVELLSLLWENNINAETYYTKRFNVTEHKNNCIKKGINVLVIVGGQEILEGKYSVILIKSDERLVVEKQDLVSFLKEHISN